MATAAAPNAAEQAKAMGTRPDEAPTDHAMQTESDGAAAPATNGNGTPAAPAAGIGTPVPAPTAAATTAIPTATANANPTAAAMPVLSLRVRAQAAQKRRMGELVGEHVGWLHELYHLKQEDGKLRDHRAWQALANPGRAQFVAKRRIDVNRPPEPGTPTTRRRSASLRTPGADSSGSGSPLKRSSPTRPLKMRRTSGGAGAAAAASGEVVVVRSRRGSGAAAPVKQPSARQLRLSDEAAQHEASILSRVQDLKMQGLWSAHKLPKIAEFNRPKMHWDYLLSEMSWLANDYRQERKWKLAMARKLARAVKKWHDDKNKKLGKALRAEQTRKRKVASNIAKEVKKFWGQMLLVVNYKQKEELKKLRNAALDKHLDFIVGQTEQFTADLTKSLAKATNAALAATNSTAITVAPHAGAVPGVAGSGAPSAPSVATPAAAVAGAPTEAAAVGPDSNPPMGPAAAPLPAQQAAPASAPTASSAAAADAAAEPAAAASAPGDNDFVPEETGEAAADDESTMRMEDEPDDAAAEVAALEKENEMSVEELLALYGYAAPGPGGASDAGDGDGDGEDDGEASSASASRAATPSKRGGSGADRRRKRRRVRSPSPIAEADGEDESEADMDVSTAPGDDGAAADDNDEDDDGADAQAQQDLEFLAGTKPAASPTPSTLEEDSATAEKVAPTGTTLTETTVKTAVPYILKATLRPYQHIGLDWLANMYDRKLNGILADEMGLGKTIQTISLFAHLALEKKIWGPHLVIVPTSVMKNWEMEFKKFLPGFKILTYYGTVKQRKEKRQGWTKQDAFHVCITSYKLAVQDHRVFKSRKWRYMVLDEAHNIKNFETKRWQTLLGFNARRRLLLTGTPLQNSLMELWSLMHFLMPHIFQSHQQFKEWFGNPVTEMVEGLKQGSSEQEKKDRDRVRRLHQMLRPFILRRLKKNVETQMPKKYEHVLPCQLSKRQRFLYDEFMSRSGTRNSLASGNYMHIINILMQLRKVCNHPNLFAEPDIEAPFVMIAHPVTYTVPSLVHRTLEEDPVFGVTNASRRTKDCVDLCFLNLCLLHNEIHAGPGPDETVRQALRVTKEHWTASPGLIGFNATRPVQPHPSAGQHAGNHDLAARRNADSQSLMKHFEYISTTRYWRAPLYGRWLRDTVDVVRPLGWVAPDCPPTLAMLHLASVSTEGANAEADLKKLWMLCVPRALAPAPDMHVFGKEHGYCAQARARDQTFTSPLVAHPCRVEEQGALQVATHSLLSKQLLVFPDPRRVQYECGKLQVLDRLMRRLKTEGHRVLIFTQMTKMLNVLEQFLNYHGHTYLRLDGSTKIDDRQRLMDRFNSDRRIFTFILSTRSGGIGINLTGADTVVFYDSDWNPTMDAQAQDRCHRIGQTRDVHIYRLVCQRTIEENILKKANQKRRLGEIAIEGGAFTPDMLNDEKEGLFSLFDGETVAEEVKRTTATAAPDGAATSAPQPSMEEAMLSAEDESDRHALRRLQHEMKTELHEFDETRDLSEDTGAGAGAAASETDSAPEDDGPASLEAQLAGLRPVEKHALAVLERYTDTYHQYQLEREREAIKEKDLELQDLQERIRIHEESMASEDDQELFYDKDEAYRAYVAAGPPGDAAYAPPNPFELDPNVYIEPAHRTQYRVSYMHFRPLPSRRRKKRRKHASTKENPAAAGARAAAARPYGFRHRAPKRASHPLGPVEDILPAIRSIFRRSEDKALRPPVKAPKYAKKGQVKPPAGASKSDRRELDSNRDAPPWLINEDWMLLQAVNQYLSPASGSINWHLIADVVNSNSSFTGRHRSPKQCRDRYYVAVLPREADPGPGTKEQHRKDGVKKRKTGPSHRLPKKQASTARLFEQDNKHSLVGLHHDIFTAIVKCTISRPAVKVKRGEARNGTHDKQMQVAIEQLGTPPTPAQLSENRILKEKKRLHEQKEQEAKRQHLLQQQAAQQQQQRQQLLQQAQQQQQQQQQLLQQQQLAARQTGAAGSPQVFAAAGQAGTAAGQAAAAGTPYAVNPAAANLQRRASAGAVATSGSPQYQAHPATSSAYTSPTAAVAAQQGQQGQGQYPYAQGQPGQPAASAAAVAASPQQLRSSQLAVYVLQHFENARAHTLVRQIVATSTKTEQAKQSEIESIITQLRQQAAAGSTPGQPVTRSAAAGGAVGASPVQPAASAAATQAHQGNKPS